MDSFEQLAAELFQADLHWTQNNVKVDLSTDDKNAIGSPSSPRWDLDLVAFAPRANILRVIECKSYLDSGGVHAAHFREGAKLSGRYKLFTRRITREIVLGRLRQQFIARGLINSETQVRLGLFFGRATSGNLRRLHEIFSENDWDLYGPDWIRRYLERLTLSGYRDSTAVAVAKILLVHSNDPHGLAR